ncbi:MAG TPA: hypothetical protein VJV78_49515 [Polyangiales bacterium]|nr:hypothetical protein [Polyangiales bacterium]
MSSGQELYRVLLQLFEHRLEVILPEPVQRGLGMVRWADVFPAHGLLPPPDTENLPQWLPAIDGWVAGVLNGLRGLDSATLEELLQAEAHVSRCVREGREPGDPPQFARTPRRYARRLPGSERERRERLDLWDRLQLAHGLFPAALRLLAACAVLAPLFWLHREVQRTIDAVPQATVSVLNGLDVPVQVHIAGTASTLEPHDHASLAVTPGDRVTVSTTAAKSGAPIEQFEADVSDAHESYVYNVASAAPLVEWTATYGQAEGPPPRRLGTRHFFTSHAQTIFAAPPRAARGSTRHTVLESGARREPLEQLEMCTNALEALELVKVHALLDEPGRARWHAWLYAGRRFPGFRASCWDRCATTRPTTSPCA